MTVRFWVKYNYEKCIICHLTDLVNSPNLNCVSSNIGGFRACLLRYARHHNISIKVVFHCSRFARVERTCFNFRYRCEHVSTFANFLGVPARLIFHEIKIGRFARTGKTTAMENGLKVRVRLNGCGHLIYAVRSRGQVRARMSQKWD